MPLAGLTHMSLGRAVRHLRDATALVPRVMLRAADGSDVFAGFRGEALSLYFGEDPVYHFTVAGELRRAYVGGRLIKAEGGRLVAMTRRESTAQTVLERCELNADEQRAMLLDIGLRLGGLREALVGSELKIVGTVPADGDAVGRLTAWLDAAPRAIVAAPRANVG